MDKAYSQQIGGTIKDFLNQREQYRDDILLTFLDTELSLWNHLNRRQYENLQIELRQQSTNIKDLRSKLYPYGNLKRLRSRLIKLQKSQINTLESPEKIGRARGEILEDVFEEIRTRHLHPLNREPESFKLYLQKYQIKINQEISKHHKGKYGTLLLQELTLVNENQPIFFSLIDQQQQLGQLLKTSIDETLQAKLNNLEKMNKDLLQGKTFTFKRWRTREEIIQELLTEKTPKTQKHKPSKAKNLRKILIGALFAASSVIPFLNNDKQAPANEPVKQEQVVDAPQQSAASVAPAIDMELNMNAARTNIDQTLANLNTTYNGSNQQYRGMTYLQIAKILSQEHGANFKKILAKIVMESKGDAQAKSWSNALGLLQLTSDAISEIHGRKFTESLSTEEKMDAVFNLNTGILYNQWLENNFFANSPEKGALSVMSWNVGIGVVQRAYGRAAQRWGPNVGAEVVASYITPDLLAEFNTYKDGTNFDQKKREAKVQEVHNFLRQYLALTLEINQRSI